jgi:hypothetical protein
VVVRDFNVTLNNQEKKGGNIVIDPFYQKMEELMVEWDLIDVN